MYSGNVIQSADDSYEFRRATSTPNSSINQTSLNQIFNSFEIGVALDKVFSQHMKEKSSAETGKCFISNEPDE